MERRRRFGRSIVVPLGGGIPADPTHGWLGRFGGRGRGRSGLGNVCAGEAGAWRCVCEDGAKCGSEGRDGMIRECENAGTNMPDVGECYASGGLRWRCVLCVPWKMEGERECCCSPENLGALWERQI